MPWCLRTKRLDMELDVRRRAIGPGAGECADLAGAHGHRAAPAQRVIESHQTATNQTVVLLIEGRDAGNLVDGTDLQMVLQVLPDTG